MYSPLSDAKLDVSDLREVVTDFRQAVNVFGQYVKQLDDAIAADIESRGGTYVRDPVVGDEPHGVVYGQSVPVPVPHDGVTTTAEGDRGKVFAGPPTAQPRSEVPAVVHTQLVDDLAGQR